MVSGAELLKIHVRTLAFVTLCCLAFVVASALVLTAHRRVEALAAQEGELRGELRRLDRVLAFVRSDYARVRRTFPSFEDMQEVQVDQWLGVEPFGGLVEKIGRLYAEGGFLFLDGASLECLWPTEGEPVSPGRETAKTCMMHVVGKKVLF